MKIAALAVALALAAPAPVPSVWARANGGDAVFPKSVRPGDLFVVRPAPGRGAPESASFLGTTYPPVTVAGEPGPVFLLGVDLDARQGREELLVRRRGGGMERLSVAIKRRAFPTERLTLPPAMVTPPAQFEERIAREQALAAEIYRTAALEALWDRGFTRPIPQPSAGNFGRRRILNGIARSPHSGQDYKAPAGTPVRAMAAGKVRLAADLYYSGQTLLVDHGSGLVSQYMHLERMLVAAGETVAAGQVIGRVGSTGRATGPHLHFGVRLFQQRVDPESLWGLFPPGPR